MAPLARSFTLALLGARTAFALAVSSTAPAPILTPDRSTWLGESKIDNATLECTPYAFAAVAATASEFPAVGSIASLQHPGVLPADVAVFTSMNDSIPGIAPRGTPTGDFSNVTYDSISDPACWFTRGGCTSPKLAGLSPDISSCPEPNTWGLTLDGGPDCSHNAYYDFLQGSRQTATLFYSGAKVATWPLEAQRGLGEGHEICAQSWSESYMTALTNEQAFAELYYTKKIIKQVLGITVTCWRPPFGDVDDRIRFIGKALGLRTILWNEDVGDATYPTTTSDQINANYQQLIDQARNGSFATQGIIVRATESNGTMSLAQGAYPGMSQAFRGGIMPVGVCNNWTQIYGEGDLYTYPDYAQYNSGTRSIALASPTALSSDLPFATGAIVISTGTEASKATATGSSKPSSAASGHNLSGALFGGVIAVIALGFALV